MGAAELALDWTPGGEDGVSDAIPASASRPHLLALEKQSDRREAGSVATISTGFVYDGASAGRALRAGLSRRYARTLPLPMEEVLLYVKTVEGQRVRRSSDPADKRAWRRMVGYGFVGVVILVLGFGPRAWLRHSSYRQAALLEQRTALREIQDHLKVRYAQAGDLRRVMAKAAASGLEAPATDRYLWQATPGDSGGESAVAAVLVPRPASTQ